MTDPTLKNGAIVTLARAIEGLPPPDAVPRSHPVLNHGTMRLRFYRPVGRDPQQPHEQDEVYIVWQGSGTFVCNEARYVFGPGDALFAPAGAVHRFEEFSDDFCTWVVFWGPPGGE
jgi:mannose-6-phosphate isomerase-like protein (cupin superfamily)